MADATDSSVVRKACGFDSELGHREGLAPASVRQVHAVMRRALAQAVRWGG